MILSLAPQHRDSLIQLLQNTHEFSTDEKAVALELIDAALGGSHDYRALVFENGAGNGDGDGGRKSEVPPPWGRPGGPGGGAATVYGYICFGPTPMTDGTWDLYWIAVDQTIRGKGIGQSLVTAMLTDIAKTSGRLIRVETSGQAIYESTRMFYERCRFEVVARIRDFYRRGDDLVVYGKYL